MAILRNHIAKRFLEDSNFLAEMVIEQEPELLTSDIKSNPPTEKLKSLVSVLSYNDQKAYYVTETVLDKLELLKVKPKEDDHYDWSVFKDLTNQKNTFIFPNNSLLRMMIANDIIHFCHLEFQLKNKQTGQGECKWVMFYLNRKTGELCNHFEHVDVKAIEKFIYCLLCFVYLSENEEIILQPNQKIGTRKQGKVINELKVPITIINSRWNVTTIRTEGFSVRGHFAIRWSGTGRSTAKLVFIEPFEKKGYIRLAKNNENNNIK